MLILALESSAGPASVAVTRDGRVLGEQFLASGLTHSQTLLPMAQNLLSALSLTPGELDAVAVTNGPGSFTGVRIGVAAAKGLAFPHDTLCCGVSTLEAIAMGGRGLTGCVVSAVMDARRSQVYNALFVPEDGVLRRLTEDRAISLQDLREECARLSQPIVLFGDGAELAYEAFAGLPVRLAPPEQRYQRAASAALLAEQRLAEGKGVSPDGLMPAYLRLPQAERELRSKQKEVI